MMKYTTPILTFLPLFLLHTVTIAQTPVSKTLVKSFNAAGKNVLLLDLASTVATQTWDNDHLRIQISITLLNGNESTLKALVESGRYNIKSEVTGDKLKISAPALQKIANVNGTEINELISFIVLMPSGFTVEKMNSAGAEGSVGETTTQSGL